MIFPKLRGNTSPILLIWDPCFTSCTWGSNIQCNSNKSKNLSPAFTNVFWRTLKPISFLFFLPQSKQHTPSQGGGLFFTTAVHRQGYSPLWSIQCCSQIWKFPGNCPKLIRTKHLLQQKFFDFAWLAKMFIAVQAGLQVAAKISSLLHWCLLRSWTTIRREQMRGALPCVSYFPFTSGGFVLFWHGDQTDFGYLMFDRKFLMPYAAWMRKDFRTYRRCLEAQPDCTTAWHNYSPIHCKDGCSQMPVIPLNDLCCKRSSIGWNIYGNCCWVLYCRDLVWTDLDRAALSPADVATWTQRKFLVRFGASIKRQICLFSQLSGVLVHK